ncbi:NAD(P)H-dependent oxidoreductase [Nitrosomonas sp. ANs5]|uniref:NAD(P)H-dependent oxidoreductase n=1 Tax=Nitrosomonas sp. ANs5 TaxID=3423941 RepID=UPI003D3422EE
MSKQIALIQGHPDPEGSHFCHALAAAYAQGAQSAGHKVAIIEIAHITFPVLRSKQDFDHGVPPESIRAAQRIIQQAGHLVFIYPLWLGTMPAYFKAFLEQVFRPGFAANQTSASGPWQKLLAGRSARIILTMGMPAFIYRWYFFAHSLKGLKRNILGFCGIAPIKDTLIGRVDTLNEKQRKWWLNKVRSLGVQGK